MSVPFMTNLLGSNAQLTVEAAWGANLAVDASNWTWTDITSDVRQVNGQGISITVGRPDEVSQAPPATCAFQLKNQSGAYTPYSPTAANYPNLRRNTPIRVKVTLNGITQFTRFFGYANGFTPGWDADGRAAYVTVSASGTFRRLQQGSKPLQSALYRYITRTLNPASIYAYWPLEDGSQATSAALVLGSGSPLILNTTAAFPLPQFAALSSVSGSAPLINMNNGTYMNGAIQGGTTSWSVQFVINFGSQSSADSSDRLISTTDSNGGFMDVLINPGAGNWRLIYTPTGLGFTVLTTATFASTLNPFDGASHRVLLNWTNAGANINWSMVVDSVTIGSGTTSGTLGTPVRVDIGGDGAASFPFALGHVLVSAQGLDILSVINGSSGETAAARLTRLCAEQAVSLSVTGTSSTTMGPQGVDTFLNLLRECEAADLGLLLDGLSQGLTYTTRSARYNQSAALTIDANSGQVPVTPPLVPVDDDQRQRNVWVVGRKDGSIPVTFTDSSGPLGTSNVGVYDAQATLNVQSDAGLTDIAAWLVHLGTVQGFRYPTLYLDLAGAPELASAWLNTTPSERIDLTNLSNRLTQHPAGTVSLVLEGYSETLTSKLWRVTANCSPYRPWEVFQIADARLGRLQTDGSTLNSSATSGATSLSVASSGPVWDTGATPFDIDVEGEQITVTAISGSSSPQTFTVTRSVNGVVKAHNSAVTVKLWKPGVLAL